MFNDREMLWSSLQEIIHKIQINNKSSSNYVLGMYVIFCSLIAFGSQDV